MQIQEILSILLNRYGLAYFYAVSAIALALTLFDKHRAKAHGRRIPENVLLLVAALGGSAAMYLTMIVIRHKTRHIKFMAGIPLILGVQAILVFYLFKML